MSSSDDSPKPSIPNGPYVRRSSALRSRPLSSMPVDRNNLHGLYIEIASLQMAASRHQNVRDSLLVQLRRSEEAIANAERDIATLQAQIDRLRGDAPTAKAKKRSNASTTDSSDADDQGFVFDY